MRPDRIIVGECRSDEALDMLQAMNTGHDGSISTVHANSPRDALSRLETMIQLSGFELPAKAMRQQVSQALDVIVQTARLADGSRRVISLTEVVGMEGDTIMLQELFTFEREGLEDGRIIGRTVTTGLRPHFVEKVKASSHEIDPAVLDYLKG
jgi:pilus assembly protein CpaF